MVQTNLIRVDRLIQSFQRSVGFSQGCLLSSRAGVPSPLHPLRRAPGLAEDALWLCPTVRPRSLSDALVASQGDTQVFHHGAKWHRLQKRQQQHLYCHNKTDLQPRLGRRAIHRNQRQFARENKAQYCDVGCQTLIISHISHTFNLR